MNLYLLSLLPLAAGPVLMGLLRRHPRALKFLDLLVMVAVAGLLLLGILPHSVAEAGVPAVGATLVGLVLPFMGRAAMRGFSTLASRVTLVAGLLGLALHTVADGMALSEQAQGASQGGMMAAAVLLHRLPVAMGVWWMVAPRHGATLAVAALACIAGATSLGFFGTELARGVLDGHLFWPLFQALLAGAMLHVLLDHGISRREQHGG